MRMSVSVSRTGNLKLLTNTYFYGNCHVAIFIPNDSQSSSCIFILRYRRELILLVSHYESNDTTWTYLALTLYLSMTWGNTQIPFSWTLNAYVRFVQIDQWYKFPSLMRTKEETVESLIQWFSLMINDQGEISLTSGSNQTENYSFEILAQNHGDKFQRKIRCLRSKIWFSMSNFSPGFVTSKVSSVTRFMNEWELRTRRKGDQPKIYP